MNGAVDPFLQNYNRSDLETASEFLTNWLPFLTKDLCDHCSNLISIRVRSLNPREYDTQESNPSDSKGDEEDTNSLGSWKDGANGIGNCRTERVLSPEYAKIPRPSMSWASKDDEDTNSLGSWKDGENGIENYGTERVQSPEYVKSPRLRMSWADMAQEEMDGEVDEDEADDRLQFSSSSSQVEEISEVKVTRKPQLSREERERRRFNSVVRKKDFICLERVNGKIVNILDGLELHLGVFSVMEQKRIVEFVYILQEKGKNKELKERTFTAPQKWMRGKGRVTIQFGCCYNYATDKRGNPPGILRNELVDPIPHLFKVMIKRLVAWHVLPPTCVPDSCIVNIYDEGDCIPPHIDNHDFVRPFCTVSFLSECNILFGTNLKIDGPGEFSGAYKIPLPVGSVFVLNGNGADVAKHCVPAVPTKRISITFRKMDESKWPARFVPEPDLQELEPLPNESVKPKPVHPPYRQPVRRDETRDNSDKPVHPPYRQPVRRDGTTGDNSRRWLGSQPRFYSQSQTRQHGPSSYYQRRTRLEY